MLNWIIGIGTLILGGGLIGNIVMHYIKRKSERVDSQRQNMYSLQDNLSEYRNTLVLALHSWYQKFSIILDTVELYLSNLENMNKSFGEFLDSQKMCLCALAPNCPKRIAPNKSEEEKFNSAKEEWEKSIQVNQTECLQKISEVLLEISNTISPFKDLLATIKEVYKLNKKNFEPIYEGLQQLNVANSELQFKFLKSHENIDDFLSDFKTIGQQIHFLLQKIEEIQIDITRKSS